MLPNEVKDYTESYQYLWRKRKNYQEFRFNIMNMLVDDKYDPPSCLFSSGASFANRLSKEVEKDE